MKMYGEVNVYIFSFLTFALDVGKWSFSYLSHFTSSIHWIGGWVGPRTGLDPVEKRKICFPCHGSKPDSSTFQPVSPSLYQLSYPGSRELTEIKSIVLFL
jgi:hypothetical protein